MKNQNGTAQGEGSRIFVARQPIFNSDQSVYGYELLFRSSHDQEGMEPWVDLDYASGKTVSDAFMIFGMETLTGGGKAFVNFTQKHLEDEVPALFPKENLVVEILENVEPGEKLTDACLKLKKQGYRVALDDYLPTTGNASLKAVADIIKVDFKTATPAQRRLIAEDANALGIVALAEKVETLDEFFEAMELGYTLFQGYFFARPQVVEGRDIPSHKVDYIRIMQELNKPELDFEEVVGIIQRDVSLSYKLLRFINSPRFGFRTEIDSIKHATTLLGIAELKKWASLVVLVGLGADKPQVLVTTSLVRGLFLSKLTDHSGLKGSGADLFLMGLLSMLDALLDKPMEELVAELPINHMSRDALLGKNNAHREHLDLLLAYEAGDWEGFSRICLSVGAEEPDIPILYMDALEGSMVLEQGLD